MKKKKTLTILIPIVVVILAVAVFFGIKYKNVLTLVFDWDNVVSFVNSQRYNREEIEGQMKDNKEKMEKIAEENPHINIRGDLTEEESKALSEGKITHEEAVSIVKGDATLEGVIASKEDNSAKEEKPGKDKEEPKPTTGKTPDKTDTGKETSTPPPETKPDKTDTKNETPEQKPSEENKEPEPPKDRASEIIAELYVIQADFISRIEAIGDKAYADYEAIRYKRDQIPAIVNSYSGEVSALERECDGKVRILLTELETELKKVDGDISVVKEIQTYYYKEKSLKKAYYLNRLNDEDYK